MNVWIFKDGEPLPIDESTRLNRVGTVAKTLLEQGHSVTWFTSSFNHQLKQDRFLQSQSIGLHDRKTLHVFHTGFAYKKTFSLSRQCHNLKLAFQLVPFLLKIKKIPDVVLCAYPTLEVCAVAKWFAKRHDVPLIIDVRDMWPETFADYLPKRLKPFFWVFLFLIKPIRKHIFRSAASLVSITPQFLDLTLSWAGRKKRTYDRFFWLATSLQEIKDTQVQTEKRFGIFPQDIVITYAGVLSRKKINLDAVIDDVKSLVLTHPNIKLVIAGNGEDEAYYQSLAEGCSNIVFPGWLDKHELTALYRASTFGLAPYVNRKDFQLSLPTKIMEYLHFGLPILTSLQGVLYELVYANNCGTYYKENQKNTFLTCIKLYLDYPALIQTQMENTKSLYDAQFQAETVYAEFASHIVEVGNHFARPDRAIKK